MFLLPEKKPNSKIIVACALNLFQAKKISVFKDLEI